MHGGILDQCEPTIIEDDPFAAQTGSDDSVIFVDNEVADKD
jgi:hypothetical protein